MLGEKNFEKSFLPDIFRAILNKKSDIRCFFMITELKDIMPVILAGGKSSRMGRNKALVTFGEKPLLSVAAEKLTAWFGASPLLVTNEKEMYASFKLPMVSDIFLNAGPLGGIHAALSAALKPHIFVFACDMPFLREDLLEVMAKLAPLYDLVVPCTKGKLEPLHAIYAVTCLPIIEEYLKRGEKKIIVFFPDMNARYLTETEIAPFSADGKVFMNINTPVELSLAKSMWKK
jgi:molybdopterin-guanine dinucleotide biosynthesis protein A